MRKLTVLFLIAITLSFTANVQAKGNVEIIDNEYRMTCNGCDGDFDTWINKDGWDHDPIAAIHQDSNWAVIHTLGYPACYSGSFYKINKTDAVHAIVPIDAGVKDCAEVEDMQVTTDSKGRTWLETWDSGDRHYKVQVK